MPTIPEITVRAIDTQLTLIACCVQITCRRQHNQFSAMAVHTQSGMVPEERRVQYGNWLSFMKQILGSKEVSLCVASSLQSPTIAEAFSLSDSDIAAVSLYTAR